MTKADPKVSQGARMERAAFRAYLRRRIKHAVVDYDGLSECLGWVLDRQQRYDKASGGLGKKRGER